MLRVAGEPRIDDLGDVAAAFQPTGDLIADLEQALA
jgi:hypothetical protein